MEHIKLTVDLNEGRTIDLCCLTCHEETLFVLGIASPFRMYVASLDCVMCGEQLITFDVFTLEIKNDFKSAKSI